MMKQGKQGGAGLAGFGPGPFVTVLFSLAKTCAFIYASLLAWTVRYHFDDGWFPRKLLSSR